MLDKKLVKEYEATTQAIAEVEREISQVIVSQRERLETLREQEAKMKLAIKEAMEKNVITKFENDVIKITYIAPTVRNGVDVTRLKTEEPEIYHQFLKQTPVNSSIRITIKEIK